MKATCIIAVTLLAFCQSAVANTRSVYYSCVPTKSVKLDKDKARDYSWTRFTIKVTTSLDETEKTVETKSAGFLGNKIYEISNFADLPFFMFATWDAQEEGKYHFIRISFQKPDLFASYTSSGGSWGLHATREEF